MKYLKFGAHDLTAAALILAATIMRIIFISQGGPLTNSDEGTIGIMALHIAYRGELPIFFYGQNYMGATQAYVGAALFHLFGPSLFSLRLGLVLMITGFLISTYLLTRLLYTRGWALVVLWLLGLGSAYVLGRELSAIGGYPETLLFGSLSCLFASWLALSYRPGVPLRKRGWRFVGYTSWGLVVGLGLWSDLLVIPFVLFPGLLLLIICWRELLQILSALFALLGLIIGGFPLLYYNLTAGPGEDSLTILRALHGTSNSYFSMVNLVKELKGTIQVSIPMMTGNPFCPVTELSFLGPTSPHTIQCTLVHGVWGFGYLFLFASAFVLALWALWLVLRRFRGGERSSELRHEAVLHTTRLMLLAAGAMALALYTFSDAPIEWPGIHARYIIGLLICTPAIAWPLWVALRAARSHSSILTFLRKGIGGGTLAAVSLVLLIGTVLAFMELSDIQAKNQRDRALINNLQRLNINRIYTDYWTCNKIAFVSNERVICGVVTGSLKPSHNRDPNYYRIVHADPRSAYAFPVDSHYISEGNRALAVERYARETGKKFRRYVLDGYVIYKPDL
jgi:hypothetical protein